MNLLPQSGGGRPRLACEVAVGGIVAARSPEPGAPLTATAREVLPETALVPSLKPGNVADRVATIAAVRRALEQVGARPNSRNSDLTLVIPDGAVRVLLLDFDALPAKLTEALPIVRFRLKKLVPFDTDEAMVSYQVMSSSRSGVRVLAVAVPRDVLSDYETVVREAGFEPGAVLPSTLAAVAGLPAGDGAALVVNTYPSAVTTAIVRAGLLVLHRTVDLSVEAVGSALPTMALPEYRDEGASAQGQAFGQNPYADRISAEVAVEAEDDVTGLPLRRSGFEASGPSFATEPAPVGRSPYAAPEVTEDLRTEIHNSFLPLPPGAEAATQAPSVHRNSGSTALAEETSLPVYTLQPDVAAEEIGRAVSVAAAYFEDLLSAPPELALSAGTLGADELRQLLEDQGLLRELGLRCHELVEVEAVTAGSVSAKVPRGLLAGVVGALRS